MNSPLVNRIVNAVLYEGYILYPYRPSAKKNQQRFTFGRVYPQVYSLAQNGAEPCTIRTECLAVAKEENAALEVGVRFLHVMAREVLVLPEPLSVLPELPDTASLKAVPELRVGKQIHSTWSEAVEREVNLPGCRLKQMCDTPFNVPIEFPAGTVLEQIKDPQGSIVGLIRRRQEALFGALELVVEPVGSQLFKIAASVVNSTPVQERELEDQEEVLMRTYASTHTILQLKGGDFISLIDTPEAFRDAARLCKNQGTWPVLVGDEKAGDRSTMLSSPIILYDYPSLAQESPGEFYDGTEIDEMLSLRVMTMTDVEKEEMRHSDERARRILERTESLSEADLLRMHGVVRELRSFDGDIFGGNRRREFVEVDDARLRVGDRVRIRPKSRADIMDMALDGRTAIIEAIEEDAENRILLALVLEDDPGKDLGFMRQPGHRFFYSVDEVEPLMSSK